MANRKGFTLLEVLIALAIISLVFFSSFFALTQMTKNNEILRDKTIASLVATNVLTQVRLGMIPFPPQTEKIADTTKMAQLDWHWELEHQPAFHPHVKKLFIVVKDANQKTVYQASGYINEKNK